MENRLFAARLFADFGDLLSGDRAVSRRALLHGIAPGDGRRAHLVVVAGGRLMGSVTGAARVENTG